MRPSEALEAHKEQVLRAIAQFDVSNPRLFGSLARGEADEDSDIDILVEPRDGMTSYDLADLDRAITSILGCKIDIQTPGGLSPRIRSAVFRDARPLL